MGNTKIKKGTPWTQGVSTLYPPIYFENLRKNFNFKTWKNKGDDDYLGMFFNKRKIKIHSLMKPKFPCFFHDEIQPINGSNRNMKWKFLQDFSKNE